jgi:hypothetical protein
MATFDQLPAEQRAIIELVVTRGRTYDALADVLQVPATRVRELALDALVELSPVTGGRVDPQWRSQIADYVLGQQSGAESTATRAHPKRSEPGRTWALSLLDSLEELYANGDRPSIPDAEAGDGAGAAGTIERPRRRERERAGREKREKPEREKPAQEKERAKEKKKLSPAAQEALQRRRRIGLIAGGAVVLAAIVVGILALAGVFSGGGGGNSSASASTNTTPTTSTAPQAQVVGQITLKPLGGANASGAAFILNQGGKPVLAVQAKLPPLPSTQRKAAYNVWLYNSPKDAFSIGAQFTDAKGNYQGVKELPSNYQKYKFVDISIQPFNNRTAHSGNSILRGAFADLQPVQQQQQQPQGSGTGTTP